jgi:hypothetical protein
MGWRFRKVFSFGRTRFSLGRRGLGTSFRLPGFRIGRTAEGKWYVSVGIFRTGFYWIKYF